MSAMPLISTTVRRPLIRRRVPGTDIKRRSPNGSEVPRRHRALCRAALIYRTSGEYIVGRQEAVIVEPISVSKTLVLGKLAGNLDVLSQLPP